MGLFERSVNYLTIDGKPPGNTEAHITSVQFKRAACWGHRHPRPKPFNARGHRDPPMALKGTPYWALTCKMVGLEKPCLKHQIISGHGSLKGRKNLGDTDNSMVTTRGKGEYREVEAGKGVNGDGRRLDLGW